MPGNPHGGSKVRDPLDWEVTEPGENRGKVIAHRNSYPTAAFHDRENRRNLRSRLWAADVQPNSSGPEPLAALNFPQGYWHTPTVRFHPRRVPSSDCVGRCRTRTGARSEAHTTNDPEPDRTALEPLAHVGDPGGQIDPCSWAQSKHGLRPLRMPTGRSNVLVSKSGCTSIRRPPGSTTTSPQLGSCCFGDFLAATSTGTRRPTEETTLLFLFQRCSFRCRFSVPNRPRHSNRCVGRTLTVD